MSTVKQDREFENCMMNEIEHSFKLSSNALDTATDFIGSNFSPEEIFTEKQLSAWAESNGFVKND